MPDISQAHTLVLGAFATAIGSIILGFIALLTQRVYLDATTQKPIEVEVPILGKMKGNYPALVFVFFGFALAFYVLLKALPSTERQKVDWDISGSFDDPKINDWDRRGQLDWHPNDTEVAVDRNGQFTIHMKIDQGKTFEDMIEKFTYTYPDRQKVEINPGQEYSSFGRTESRLSARTATTREYKPIKLQALGEGR